MKCDFLATASAEMEEAIDFYNAQESGLGDVFEDEIRATLARILAHPQAWTKLSRRTRKCGTNRFPYGIIYQVRDDGILVVAVAHLHRKPFYWRDRL
jgi:plasmid stabilization system protein ParE